MRPQEAEAISLWIGEFANAFHYRSATVDELEIAGDYFRRPLRPEDLHGIDFGVQVTAATVCDLPSLAAQRVLRCLQDLSFAWISPPRDAAALERRAQFHSDAQRLMAARLAPMLEKFAFGFLADEPCASASSRPARLEAEFRVCAAEMQAFAHTLRRQFAAGELTAANLRFLFVQRWCLRRIRQATLAGAQARGCFDPLVPSDRPSARPPEEEALASIADALGVQHDAHAFWQFYLPTSLGSLNHIGALAARPEASLALIGACFVDELATAAFAAVALEAAAMLGVKVGPRVATINLDVVLGAIGQRYGRAIRAVESGFGVLGLAELARGQHHAARFAQLECRDIEAQLRWLGAIDDYRDVARQIDGRIQSQRPDIDRETFIEPREMCSTTHVHNDHRLVVIESGNMVFWASPGMRLRLAPGEMLLVPRGRLHGSSVESSECVYHQPIIPEEWITPLVDRVDRRHGWTFKRAAALAGAS